MKKESDEIDLEDLARFEDAVREEQIARQLVEASQARLEHARVELDESRARLGLPPKVGRPQKTGDIMEALADGAIWSIAELVEQTGRSRSSISNHLHRFVQEGKVQRVKPGHFRLPRKVDGRSVTARKNGKSTEILILEILADGDRRSIPELAQITGRSRSSVSTNVKRLCSEGKIKRFGRGQYGAPEAAPAPENADPQDEDPSAPAATADQVLDLMRRFPLNWSPSEFGDYLDVDAESIRPVLEKLVEQGLVRRVRKQFTIVE